MKMAEIKSKPKPNVHHGKNIKYARDLKGLTQEGLAYDLQLTQSQVSDLEKKSKIDDKILQQVAKALDVPTEFLKSFAMEDTIHSYNVINNESYTMSTGENNTGNEINQLKNQTIENQTINYTSDETKEAYQKALDEKEKWIQYLINENKELKEKLEKK